MTDPIDMFSEEAPPEGGGGRWDFLKRPWFIIFVGVILAVIVILFSINQVMTTVLHSRPERNFTRRQSCAGTGARSSSSSSWRVRRLAARCQKIAGTNTTLHTTSRNQK